MKKWLQKRLKNEKGLTLVELLAVIVILGIIAAIAVPAIGNVISNTKDKAILADASSILTGAKLAMIDGACTSDTSCVQTDLTGFVEGIDSTATYSVSKTGDVWSVTYSEFANIKNVRLSENISSNTSTEENLNTLMGNK
ncbi:prepilin-type N-terminal cleavage/methylation domain-containing protein [Sporosarcina sp. ACRSM]|uniref:prepilin-type N-terminal cleavage/methylation domain-containing protein n=1 Tax=Sporosarcina sp. ACRSM TaxID=2918216 RepID=UPI001EF42FC2|nr:prepilin-type N-terminal cleavage/methylation domain-containing protein [Sporosarcina sp. ACRSM]MCG7336986.1 prepilin-type N-terminal cleavage/methylation domain-containing protein [Sporosarcina sp. ACRSM]